MTALRSSGQRGRVAGKMDVAQLDFARAVVALVAPAGAPIAHEVLGRGDDMG